MKNLQEYPSNIAFCSTVFTSSSIRGASPWFFQSCCLHLWVLAPSLRKVCRTQKQILEEGKHLSTDIDWINGCLISTYLRDI